MTIDMSTTRIEQLAEQCEVWHTYGDCDRCEVDIGTFAKLIVQEYVLQKSNLLNDNAIDNYLSNAIKNGWYPVNEDSYRQGFVDAVKEVLK